MHRPPRLNYFTGNQLELLADRLADELGADPLPAHLSETILVPSRGMGSWLTIQLARRWGVAGSLDLPFPARFVDQLAEKFGLGRPAPVDPFRPAAQLWELHDLFWRIESGGLQSDDLKPVRDHLRDDSDGRKRYQLARRLSGLYSAYQFTRPGELERWQKGGWFSGSDPLDTAGEPWQRALWTELIRRHEPAEPPSHRILELVHRLDRGEFEPDRLPERLSVFGASTLPPMILQVLGALARHRPVDLYLLVPTPGYIADLKSRRVRDREQDPRDLAPAEELVGELGKSGREFFEALLDLDASGAAFEEAGFADPGHDSVLHHLQSALFASAGEPVATMAFDEDDRSLLLHSCHSPMREMEVLRDEVLAALADGTADSVADVLLLVPDIRKYAPFARSVFGGAIENGDGKLRLPLRVADRSRAADQPFARLILLWLELAAARLTLGEVFPVLHEGVVRSRFGLAEEDLDSLRDRLRDAGVIWGVDPATRARRTGTPEFGGVSWREGIDRLLLGCFTGPLDEMIEGILPASDAMVSNVDTLARLAAALDRLFDLIGQLEGPHPITDWVQRIRAGMLSLTDASGEREALQRARCIELLERLQTDASDSVAPVGRLALLDLLRREFAAMDSGAGFVSGMVTVAELRPMRSLPASVVAVAGLDAESFPRHDPQDGLDLAARHRRRGDRSPRDDDRQLFLELLLSARERLILSFVGRSQQDDRPRTLSPCVQELLDTVERLGTTHRMVEHSLQPFAALDCPERTYDHGLVEAARGLDAAGSVARFIDVPLPGPESPGDERIALTDLREFWKSPSQWFCRRVVNLALARDREEAESEALRLDDLQKWRLRDLALRAATTRLDSAHARARLGLPTHDLMTLEFDAIHTQIERVGEKLGFPLDQIIEEPVEVVGDGFIVAGDLKRRKDGPLIEVSASGSVSAKYQIQALISHVVADRGGLTTDSWFGPAGIPEKIKLWKPLEDPESVLASLVEGYRMGQREPLRFFPRTSLAFAKAWAKNPDADPLWLFELNNVQNEWSRPPEDTELFGKPGEKFEEAVALCVRGFGIGDVCDAQFLRWSKEFAGWLSQVERKS